MRFGIRPQVLLLTVIPATSLLVLLALSGLLVQQTAQGDVASLRLVEAIRLSDTLWNDLTAATRSAQRYLQHGADADLADYRTARTAIPADTARFTATLPELPQLHGVGLAYARRVDLGMELIASVIDAYRHGGIAAARRVAGSPYARRFGDDLQRAKIAFDQAAQPRAAQAIVAARTGQRRLERGIVAVALVGLGLTLLFALLYAVGIVRRLSALGDNARRLAFGAPTVPVAGNDELTELDQIYHEMADRIRTTQVELREERAATALLQQALLPALPDIPGLRFDSTYATPSAGPEIGGDCNVVRHTPGPVRVRFAIRDRSVVLAVEDRNPSFPHAGDFAQRLEPPGWDAESGRGLFLISALCSDVRVAPTRDGKCTTVVLPVP